MIPLCNNILTKNGWKRITQIIPGIDYIATLDKDGNMVYSLLKSKVITSRRDNDMIFIRNENVNIYLDKNISVYIIHKNKEHKIKLKDLDLFNKHVFKKTITKKCFLEEYGKSGKIKVYNLGEYTKVIMKLYESGYSVDFDSDVKFNKIDKHIIKYAISEEELSNKQDLNYSYMHNFNYEINFCDIYLENWDTLDKNLCLQRFEKMLWVCL